MRKLNKLSTVGLFIFLFCSASAVADEVGSTFGFQSQYVEDDDPITLEEKRLTREALRQNVISNMYQKNVLNKSKYKNSVERDRLTLMVIEKKLRDPKTPDSERKELEQQWLKFKKAEKEHLKNYKEYSTAQEKLLKQKAEDNNRKIEERIRQLRQDAIQKAKNGDYSANAEGAQEDFLKVNQGQLSRKYKKQLNDLTNQLTADQTYSSKVLEEEEEEELSFERVFSEDSYQNVQRRKDVAPKKPMYAETVADAQNMFAGKDGLLLPNSPLGLSAERREVIRQKVEAFMKKNNFTKIRADERETLNAILFNYGIQVLETGEVIALEVIDDYTNGERMVAPDVPVPPTAQQVYVGPENLINEIQNNQVR